MCVVDRVVYSKSLKETQSREPLNSFVSMKITLFAYVNLKGGSKPSDIWFLKVKSVPCTWNFSFSWDIIKSINNGKVEESFNVSIPRCSAHLSSTGPQLLLKYSTLTLQMVRVSDTASLSQI